MTVKANPVDGSTRVATMAKPAVSRRRFEVSEDINVLALVKGDERYIFLYSDSNRSQTLRLLGRYASNPDLSFSWYDAAILSQKIRRQAHEVDPIQNRLTFTQTTDSSETLDPWSDDSNLS